MAPCHSLGSLLQRAVRAEEAARAGRQSGAAGGLAEQRGCDEADDHQVGDALGRTDQAEGAGWQPAPVSAAVPYAWAPFPPHRREKRPPMCGCSLQSMAVASRAQGRSLYCIGHCSPRLVGDMERRWREGRPVWVVRTRSF